MDSETYRGGVDLAPVTATVILDVLVEGPPRSKERPRTVVKNGRTMTFTPATTREAEKKIKEVLNLSLPPGWTPTIEKVRIRTRYWLDQRRLRDGDNLDKLVWDAGTGVIWVNDNQIVDWGGRIEGYSQPRPRTEIKVWLLEGQPPLTADR